MKRLFPARSLAAAGLAVFALAAASAAHARSDVFLSIGVQSPGVYLQPAPVYMQPRQVYVQPQPFYGQHRYEMRRGPYGDYNRDGIANVYDRDGHRHARRNGHRYGPYGDLDRDGVSNQDDRDRDGDGVRNRFDRFPNDGYRY